MPQEPESGEQQPGHYPIHSDLEDLVSEPKLLSVLSNPHSAPEKRLAAALTVAQTLVQRCGMTADSAFALLEPSMNGEKQNVHDFLHTMEQQRDEMS
jgi:hypothetical protein